MKFTKARVLIQIHDIGREKQKAYIEIPGYLYLYQYDGSEHKLFVHRKVVYDKHINEFLMQRTWTVSEPRTGLSVDSRSVSRTRKTAVSMAAAKLLSIKLSDFHEAVLLGMADSPERVATWRINSPDDYAVKIRSLSCLQKPASSSR